MPNDLIGKIPKQAELKKKREYMGRYRLNNNIIFVNGYIINL